MVAQTDHILTLVKEIGKEYSHSWDSGQEGVHAHYSPQASQQDQICLSQSSVLLIAVSHLVNVCVSQ